MECWCVCARDGGGRAGGGGSVCVPGGPVLLVLGGRLPLGSLGSQLPCLLLHPLPVLLGPKELGGGAASYKSGSPATSSLSRALFPSPDSRDHVFPRATSSQVPRAPAESTPSPRPPPSSVPKSASGGLSSTRPTTAGVSQPRRALTRRTGGSRSSRPAAGWASASCLRGRPPAGIALLWRRSCYWRCRRRGWRLRHSAVLLGRQNHRLWEWGAGGTPGPDLSWPHALRLNRLESEQWGQQDEGAARRRLPGATRR